MKLRIPRPHGRARLVASLVMASAVGLMTVSAASAQTLKPADDVVTGVPTTLSVIPGVSTAPGQPPATGVTLDQAKAAYKALSAAAPANGRALVSPAASSISAEFIAGALVVFGNAQDD